MNITRSGEYTKKLQGYQKCSQCSKRLANFTYKNIVRKTRTKHFNLAVNSNTCYKIQKTKGTIKYSAIFTRCGKRAISQEIVGKWERNTFLLWRAWSLALEQSLSWIYCVIFYAKKKKTAKKSMRGSGFTAYNKFNK